MAENEQVYKTNNEFKHMTYNEQMHKSNNVSLNIWLTLNRCMKVITLL